MKNKIVLVLVAAVAFFGLSTLASTAAEAPTVTTKVTAEVIHPYWDQARWRDWHNGGPVPWVCVDNHSPFALQVMAEQWDYQMNDGYLYYEDGNNCASFWERETIDVFGSDYPGGPCSWKSVTYDGNYYANVNMYINTADSMASTCFYSTIASNHRKSVAIGQGLGAQTFTKIYYDGEWHPGGIHVMDNDQICCVSYAQQPDGLNWDWRY